MKKLLASITLALTLSVGAVIASAPADADELSSLTCAQAAGMAIA